MTASTTLAQHTVFVEQAMSETVFTNVHGTSGKVFCLKKMRLMRKPCCQKCKWKGGDDECAVNADVPKSSPGTTSYQDDFSDDEAITT